MKGRAALLAVLAVVIAVALALGLRSRKQPPGGRVAPALPSEHLSGAPVALADLLSGGHPAAVVFWASWCGPCAKEAGAIERFSRSIAGRGRIVGVDWNDARSGALAFVHAHRWTFPVVRDGEGTVGADYGLTGLPTTFVLDGAGRIVATLRGPQTGATLSRALRSAERA